jgi:hypothetical protein
MYRIVRTDNFGRSGEHPGCNEEFIGEPNSSREDLLVQAADMNDTDGPSSFDYYKVEHENYKLLEFEP